MDGRVAVVDDAIVIGVAVVIVGGYIALHPDQASQSTMSLIHALDNVASTGTSILDSASRGLSDQMTQGSGDALTAHNSLIPNVTVSSSNASDDEKREQTPTTHPGSFSPVRGTPGKQNNETGEIFEKDKFHKDHWEVYGNKKDYDKGKRDRDVWDDGRPKSKK